MNLVVLVECVSSSAQLPGLVGVPVANLIICCCKLDEDYNIMLLLTVPHLPFRNLSISQFNYLYLISFLKALKTCFTILELSFPEENTHIVNQFKRNRSIPHSTKEPPEN